MARFDFQFLSDRAPDIGRDARNVYLASLAISEYWATDVIRDGHLHFVCYIGLRHHARPEKQRVLAAALEREELWTRVANGWRVEVLAPTRRQRQGIPPKLRLAVIDRDGRICQLCGIPIFDDEVLHVDHKKPVIRGGLTVLDNLQVAHGTCNLQKGARVMA